MTFLPRWAASFSRSNCWKRLFLSSIACFVFSIPVAGSQPDDWRAQFDGGVAELRSGHLDAAERTIRNCLELAEVSEGDNKKRTVLGLKALGLLYAARALERERTYKKANITVNDLLSLGIIGLVVVLILTLILRHSPERPKSVVKIQRWIEQKKVVKDDGIRQVSSSMMALFICAIIGFGLMVVSVGGLRLLSFMEKREQLDSGSEKFIMLSTAFYRKAYALEGQEFNGSKAEILRKYQQFQREASVR
ncbi:MAG: hypothetical protein K2Z81_08270 [Cyanobacteria bacterium]|nr:hypothetical protein [Cyanobacteriota bacterium]